MRECCAFGSLLCDAAEPQLLAQHVIQEAERTRGLQVQLEGDLEGRYIAILCRLCYRRMVVDGEVLRLPGLQGLASVYRATPPYRAQVMVQLEQQGLAPHAELRREIKRQQMTRSRVQ